MTGKQNTLGPTVILALLVQQFLSGLTFPIAKFGLDLIEPFTFAFFRFGLSSLTLLTIVAFRRPHPPVEKKDMLKLFGLGVLIIPFNQTAYLAGQKMTAAGHGALLFATVPIWLFLAGMIHLKEKFVLRRGVGVALGMVGVMAIVGGGAIQVDHVPGADNAFWNG